MKSRSALLKLVQARLSQHHFVSATHLPDEVDALRQLMRPVSIETTAGYRPPVVAQASNPLDDLLSSPL